MIRMSESCHICGHSKELHDSDGCLYETHLGHGCACPDGGVHVEVAGYERAVGIVERRGIAGLLMEVRRQQEKRKEADRLVYELEKGMLRGGKKWKAGGDAGADRGSTRTR